MNSNNINMSLVFGICLILIGLMYTADGRNNITNYRELNDETFNGVLTCISELNLNIEICSDMLNNTIDHSDIKFDGCKCLLSCVSKIIGTMNKDDGKWNEKIFWEFVAMIGDEKWKEDAEILGKNCVDRVNTHCSAGYVMFKCAMNHSKMLKSMADNYMNQKKTEMVTNITDVEYEEE